MNINLEDDVASLNTLLNAYVDYDFLSLLTTEARNFQEEFVRNTIREYRDNNIVNPEMKFYIDQRLSNWGQGHFRQGAGTQIPLLVDFGLARLQASYKFNKTEDIHFNIIRFSQPDLLRHPFLNQRWGGETRKLAASLDADIVPINVPVSKSFPWQFDAYPTLKNVCIDWLLDHFEGFSPWISKKRINQAKKS